MLYTIFYYLTFCLNASDQHLDATMKPNTSKGAYFLYQYFSPSFRAPLTISVLLHLAFALFAALQETPYPQHVFTIELASAIDREVELQEKDIDMEDLVRQIEKKDSSDEAETTGETASKAKPHEHETVSYSALKKDAGALDKNNNTGEESQFFSEYEETLFQREDNDRPMELSSDNGEIEWDVEKALATQSGKTRTLEPISAPKGTGKTRTENIIWVEGSARKMIGEPKIEYPEIYSRQAIQGSVRLLLEIDNGGNVVFIEIIRSSGYSKLDILAVQGMRKQKFTPKSGGGAIDKGEMEVFFELSR